MPPLSSQTQAKEKVYYTTIQLINGSKYKNTYLLEVKDSALIIMPKTSETSNSADFIEVPLQKIKSIKFRKVGALATGALVGASAGILIGASIGMASGDDDGQYINFSAEEKALGAAISLLTPGLIIGMLVGASGKKIEINGSQEEFELIKNELRLYILPLAVDG